MRRLALTLAVLSLAACDSSADAGPDAVYVGNRGAGAAGGTITRLSPDGPDLPGDIGGRVESVVQLGRRLYVLVDAPDGGRLDVVDLDTGTRERQSAVPAPRRMAVVAGVGYVSNAGTYSLTPVTLATGQTGPPIQVGDQPVGVAAVGNRVFVATWNDGVGTDVRVVSAVNRTVVQTIEVGCAGPRDLVADGDGDVWAVCTGGGATGQVVVIDGASGAVVARFPLDRPVPSLGQTAAFSARHDELFVSNGAAVLRFDTRANAPAGRIEVAGVSAVAYDDRTDRLLLGRPDPVAPDAAPGIVTVHDRSGAETARAPAGVWPVAIAPRPE